MKNIAVFASGSGSNFQAIIDAVKEGKLQANLKLLVCDRPGAFAVERAVAENINHFVFTAKNYASKLDYESDILKHLEAQQIDFIVLAGYMRLIGPTLLKKFEGRIVNIHPSLLPAFPGKDAIGQALKAKVKVSGITIHFVDEGMDTGPIIAQKAIEISQDETLQTLQSKVHEMEHKTYPKVLQKLLQS